MSKTLDQPNAKTPLTRRQLLQLPPEARRPILEEPAAAMSEYYRPCPDRDSWLDPETMDELIAAVALVVEY